MNEKIKQINNKIDDKTISNTDENLNELKNKIIIDNDEKILNLKVYIDLN